MKRKSLFSLTVFCFLLLTACSNNSNVSSLESIEQLFEDAKLHLKPQAEDNYPTLLGVKPNVYELLDDSLYIYVFKSKDVINEASKELSVKQSFKAPSYVYQLKNVLVIYITLSPPDESFKNQIDAIIAPAPTPITPTPTVKVIPPTPEPTPKQLVTYLESITNDEDIREQLYRMYGRFNGLVGNYENYKTTSKEEWEQYLSFTFMKPEVYKRFAEVTSSEELEKDLNNLATLVAFARIGLEDGTYSKEDITALRYAYEIINDVQAWSLPQSGDDLNVRHKFGASFALDEHEQATEINDWIVKYLK